MENKFFWTCPYCKHENKAVTDKHIDLVYCDAEEGGCDQLVVVKFTVTTSTEVFKVEGELMIEVTK